MPINWFGRRPATIACLIAALLLVASPALAGGELRGTGDLGIVVERSAGSVLIVDTTKRAALARVEGLGDLSHASAVFSRDQRFAYVFGRDGGLTKVDLLTASIAKRVVQAGNAIGGAISDDGALIAVSNYEPGGVRVFDSEALDLVADIPAVGADGKASKTVGLVDLPGRRFAYALYDAGEIWTADFSNGAQPALTKLNNEPVFAVARPDGRHVWVNFAHPLNDTIDVVDTTTLKIVQRFRAGPAVLHMEFAPRGHEVWVSVRDDDRVLVYDAATFAKKGEIAAGKPSGIFFTARATRIGQ
ncbi:MAG: cytochrome D1 domain-containing protein [Rhodoplanes sp.]